MAFPTVAGTSSNGTITSTSHAIALPASIAVGDLLVVFFNVSNLPSVTWPAGWTSLFAVGLDGNLGRFQARWRIADGSEGSSITIATGSAQSSGAIVYRIADHAGAAPECSANATGTSNAADPASLTPTWGADDTLWLATAAIAVQSALGTTYPTDYTNGITESGERLVLSAERTLNAASEDPGAFGGFGSHQWAAYTIGIKPADSATAPTAPTGLSATSNVAAPVVSWTPGTGQTSQYVHRLASGASAPTDATTRTSADLGDSASSWTDDTEPAGGTYDYYVEAANGVGSTFSATPATATVSHPPTLSVTQPPEGSYPSGVEITCAATANDVDGDTLSAYVEVSTDGGSTYGTAVACPTTITPADGSVRLRYTSDADAGGLTADPVTRDLIIGSGGSAVLTLEEPMLFVRQTGVATTLPVPCKNPATGAFLTTNVLAPGDVTISIDGATPTVLADDTNAASWVFRNGRVQVPLSAAEVTGEYITLLIEDADGAAFIAPPVDVEVVAYDPTDTETSADVAAATAEAILATPANLLATDASGRVTASAVSDKTGYALTSAERASVAGAVRTELATELSRVDAAISTRLASASYTAPDNASVTAIKAKTDNLPASPAAVGSAMTLEAGERTNVASAIANHVETAGALSLDEIGQFLQVIHAGSTSGATANGGTIVWEHPTIPGWSLTFTADKYGNRASAGTLVKP